jgi:hypothetical protein
MHKVYISYYNVYTSFWDTLYKYICGYEYMYTNLMSETQHTHNGCKLVTKGIEYPGKA